MKFHWYSPFRKRNRGLKRYYRNLGIKIDIDYLDWLNVENSETLDKNWHLHFDRNGYGNKSFKRRKPHLDKLFRHFDFLIGKTKGLPINFQLYAVLLDFDSSSDALFLHTHNPNNSQFPFKVSDLKVTTTLTNKELDGYISSLVGYEKLYGKAEEAFCLIYKRNAGQPF